MKVVVKSNIDSVKYGILLEGSEVEVDDITGADWIKQGLAYGKDEVYNSDKGNNRVKEKAK